MFPPEMVFQRSLVNRHSVTHVAYDMWEVLMLVDSEAAARVSGAAETVDYFR